MPIMMNEPLKLQNEPGVWPRIMRRARECFEDAACHAPDLPNNGKYAMVHVSFLPVRAKKEEEKTAVRWSLIMSESSELLREFPPHLVNIYKEMDQTKEVAAFIHLSGETHQSTYWAVHVFKRHAAGC